ncbi:MAG: TIGR03905 family TSCPD domain-containing protein [Clostridia bacterium]
MRYLTSGTCSVSIDFTIEDNKLHNVVYTGGCNGNLQGISKLVEGMDIDKAIEMLSGIHCGNKSTSCPDQLATALKQYKAKKLAQPIKQTRFI